MKAYVHFFRALPLFLIIVSVASCDQLDRPLRRSSRAPNSSGGSDRQITIIGPGNNGPRNDGGPQWFPDLGWPPSPTMDIWPWPQADQSSTPPIYPDAAITPPTKLDQSVAPPPDTAVTPPTGVCGNDFESEVFKLVNQERSQNGLSPYKCGPLGTTVAHNYSQVMCDKDHFDHTGPDGSSPFDRMQQGGISFQTAGENIAAGQDTPQSVMQSWMSSSGHRANILGDFEYIGIGYVSCSKGWGHYWTQVFWR